MLHTTCPLLFLPASAFTAPAASSSRLLRLLWLLLLFLVVDAPRRSPPDWWYPPNRVVGGVQPFPSSIHRSQKSQKLIHCSSAPQHIRIHHHAALDLDQLTGRR